MFAMPMEQGFNSDVVFEGVSYHIQTEDWGDGNPYVVTKVFNSGTVVLSLKTSYGQIENMNFAVGRQAVRLGMREQHQKVLDQLVSGTLIQPRIK
jgi:hypothetical protein